MQTHSSFLRTMQRFEMAADAAFPGDTINVGPGEWCGATITTKVDLFGQGKPTIIGCASSPKLAGVLRIGFFLPAAAASGTTIRHFVFDGEGASNANLDPLSFAVFARHANDVVIEQNTVLGTIQAITNTAGSGWTVNHNKIEGFSVLLVNLVGSVAVGSVSCFKSATPPDRGRLTTPQCSTGSAA